MGRRGRAILESRDEDSVLGGRHSASSSPLDVNRGEIAWKVPLGFVESLKAKGFDQTGTLNIGGSIATAGGVDLHRRHDRLPLPRVRVEDRQAAVGDRARRRARIRRR